MQPSAKWGVSYSRLNGLNVRTGASLITDTDFDKYPAFTMAQNQNAPAGIESIIMGVFQADNTFPLNAEIDDWSVAYTAVNNDELSLNNIGVFTGIDADLSYKTDETALAPVAFLTGQRYHVIVNNIAGTPNLNDANQFKEPPYNNSREIWSPNAAANPSTSDAAAFYRGLNYNGYATQIYSFGVKSLFLEIRIIPVAISGDPLGNTDYSLKDYAALPQEDRNNNPIGRAYARVYRRSNTNGTYSYTSGDFSTILPVIARPLKNNSYTSFVPYRLLKNDGDTNYLQLPLFGIAHTRSQGFVRWTTSGYGDYFFGADKVEGKRITDLGGGEYNYNLYIAGTEDNFEYLRKCCAQYGLFFCDSVDLALNDHLYDSTYEANNGRWLHEKMHLGIIEDNGYTEGRYSTGIENGLQQQFNWTESTESSYDPDIPPVPENAYSTQTVFNQIGDLTTMTHRYVLEAGAVENLGTALWDITDFLTSGQTDYTELNQKILDTFQSSNPIDCIVSLQRYPLNIPKADSTLVKLGNYETVIAAHTMEKTVYVYLFEMKNPVLPLFYDSFLDYEPYTHFELYVPFCGTTAIEPADVLNRKLAVQLVVDFTTGTCTGYIMSDNLVIKTVNGQIAIDIPVSGLQQITAASQINNAIATAAAAQKQEIAATLGTVSISGITSLVLNPVKTLTNGQIAQINAQKAEYDLQHQNIQPHIIGAATSAASWAIDLNCRLLIYYPTGEVITDTNPPSMKGQKLAEYGHTIGFACCLTGQLQDFLGLTVAVNADLNGITTNGALSRPATAQELQMLEAALNEGIII